MLQIRARNVRTRNSDLAIQLQTGAGVAGAAPSQSPGSWDISALAQLSNSAKHLPLHHALPRFTALYRERIERSSMERGRIIQQIWRKNTKKPTNKPKKNPNTLHPL